VNGGDATPGAAADPGLDWAVLRFFLGGAIVHRVFSQVGAPDDVRVGRCVGTGPATGVLSLLAWWQATASQTSRVDLPDE
jgi:hypothetical protein